MSETLSLRSVIPCYHYLNQIQFLTLTLTLNLTLTLTQTLILLQDLSGGTLAVGSHSEVLATIFTGSVRFTPAVTALKWAYQPMAIRDEIVAKKVTIAASSALHAAS